MRNLHILLEGFLDLVIKEGGTEAEQNRLILNLAHALLSYERKGRFLKRNAGKPAPRFLMEKIFPRIRRLSQDPIVQRKIHLSFAVRLGDVYISRTNGFSRDEDKLLPIPRLGKKFLKRAISRM